MKPANYLIILVVLVICSGSWLAVSPSVYADTPRVLVVHSYHEDQQEHVVKMTEGIIAAFKETAVDIRFFHMDAKRNTSEEWKQNAGQRAKQLLAEFQPVVVISMDDIAQRYFAADYAGAPSPPYFVFGGVNNDPALYGFPADNVTGVLERPNVVESVELLQKIVPQVKNLLIIADKSVTTDSFIAYCKTLALPVQVLAYEQPLTLSQWRAVLTRYRYQADAIGLYVLRTISTDETGSEKVPEQELIEMINNEFRIPTVGFFDSSAESGVLCGISVSMFEQGYVAGHIARDLLRGKKPNDFQIKPTEHGRIQLNLLTAEKLGIEIPYRIIQRAEILVRTN